MQYDIQYLLDKAIICAQGIKNISFFLGCHSVVLLVVGSNKGYSKNNAISISSNGKQPLSPSFVSLFAPFFSCRLWSLAVKCLRISKCTHSMTRTFKGWRCRIRTESEISSVNCLLQSLTPPPFHFHFLVGLPGLQHVAKSHLGQQFRLNSLQVMLSSANGNKSEICGEKKRRKIRFNTTLCSAKVHCSTEWCPVLHCY